MSTYDPVSTATSLAENYVYARQNQLDTASTKVQTQTTALTSLKSSLTTFSSALSSLTSKGSVIAQTASVSSATAATANASATASAGSYSFQVDKLATAQQSLYDASALGLEKSASDDNLLQIPQSAGFALGVRVDGVFYAVDLSTADADGDQKLSVAEIARALNAAAESKVTAAVMTDADGKQQLLLNATSTGTKGSFSLEVDKGDGNGSAAASGQTLVAADDAHFKVGGANGIEVVQSTNTYTGIDGLSVEFKEISTSPVVVTVAKDQSATKANMQSFVDAYNTLLKALDKLTAYGNTETSTAGGALAGDTTVRSLRSKLNTLLRSSVGGVSLMDYGISAQRDGTIALDSDRFAKKVAANPEGLTNLLGATNTLEYKRSGVLGSMQTYLDSWTKSTGGILQARQESLQKQQTQFTKQQAVIDALYEQAYQRYLTQFTALSTLEDQMSSTTSMLASMFSSD